MALPRLAIVSCVLLALAGCTSSSDGTGSASVFVQDAPTDEFTEIHVVFTKVEVHASGSDGGAGDDVDDNGTSDTADDGANATSNGTAAGWRVLFEDNGVDVDLLNVTGTQAAFLGEADLPAGRYQQIRIHVTQAYGIDANGTRVEIALANAILRTSKSFEVEADRETQIVIDFDLDRSLKESPHGWRMTPVIGKVLATVVADESEEPEAGETTAVET